MVVTEMGMVELLQPCISVLVDVLMMALQFSRESNVLLPLSTLMTFRAVQLLKLVRLILKQGTHVFNKTRFHVCFTVKRKKPRTPRFYVL